MEAREALDTPQQIWKDSDLSNSRDLRRWLEDTYPQNGTLEDAGSLRVAGANQWSLRKLIQVPWRASQGPGKEAMKRSILLAAKMSGK